MNLNIKNKTTNALPIIVSMLIVLISRPVSAATSCTEGNAAACLNQGKSGDLLNLMVIGINFLAALVGISAVIMLIVAGIQYSSAADNPQAVQAAKQKINNVLLALVTFFLLYAFLQWLIPGGLAFR